MTRTAGPSRTTPRPGQLEARFLAIISHELRTPLTTIASFTESLDNGELAPDERSLAVRAVRRNTERMLTLVEDLMMVSRLQTADLPLNTTTIDPVALFAEAAESLAGREPHTATVLAAPDGPALVGDRELLHDLLYAVFGIVASGAADRSAEVATDAGPQGWTVTVTARQAEQLTDEHLMAGMLAIPQPPHRRRSTALWMLLADAIATRHGGTVRLTFDPAAGTAGAAISLPLRPPEA